MNIDQIVEDYNTKLEEMRNGLTNTLKTTFKEVFEENPNLYMLCWTQYAPYFNDGDPCEFSVNDIYAVNKEILNDENYDEESLPSPYEFEDEFAKYRMQRPSSYYFDHYPNDDNVVAWNAKNEDYKKEVTRVNKFIEAISKIDEDVFKAAFGEDNAVWVFVDEIVTEDYSGNHD